MSHVQNLVRRNSNIPGWVPAVFAIVVVAWLSVKIAAGGGVGQAGGGFGDIDSNDGRSGSSSGEIGGNSPRDEDDPDTGDAGSSAGGSGEVEGDGDSGDGDSCGGESPAGTEEGEVAHDSGEEDFVVLAKEEIGPAIRSACSCAPFQECCAEVRKVWELLQPSHVESTCARMYDILRENDPVAASLLAGLAAPAEQHRTLTILMSTIISRSAKPALLEETLRSLGERHIQRGAKETHFLSMGQASIQALAETLRIGKQEQGGKEPPFPPIAATAAAAWEAFFTTVSGCMMLAGAGMAPRQCACRRRMRESRMPVIGAAAAAVDTSDRSSRERNLVTDSKDSSENGSDTGQQPAAAAVMVDACCGYSRDNGTPRSIGSEGRSENCSKSRPVASANGESLTRAESRVVHVGWERRDGLPSFSLILESSLALPSTMEKASLDAKIQSLPSPAVPEAMPACGGMEAVESGNGSVRVM